MLGATHALKCFFMEHVILDIVAALRRARAEGKPYTSAQLVKLLNAHNKQIHSREQYYSKKKLLPYYVHVKTTNHEQWKQWGIDKATERELVQLLQIKPRRTSSGVATITVITKPWGCSSACVYCPNDIRMPKSYLSNEPACQRAERNFFDPYLQVVARLRALMEMGHATDKVELIVLGGTWTDYPLAYQYWFMHQLFLALNDGVSNASFMHARKERYENSCIPTSSESILRATNAAQRAIDSGQISFNEAHEQVYGKNTPWERLASWQVGTLQQLEQAQHINESARHRCVGLVIETRPDTITAETLTRARQFGCTKIQMGIQTLDAHVLAQNKRATTTQEIERAFALLRLYGFKLHTHFMVNLYGSDPKHDKRDFHCFVTDKRFCPDEIKVYPCVLTKGTALEKLHAQGKWKGYTEAELLDILATDICETPGYCRISRMIRDISSEDIIDGNKKSNLRQLAELEAQKRAVPIQEMRYREIKGEATSLEELHIHDIAYETNVSHEHFLQWVTPDNHLAGFLRLSLPHESALKAWFGGQTATGDGSAAAPVAPGQAMIREVHIYGRAARIENDSQNAQHLGLGKKLIARAEEIAREAGYSHLNVISAVGTRAYYRNLGFVTSENELYQTKCLSETTVLEQTALENHPTTTTTTTTTAAAAATTQAHE